MDRLLLLVVVAAAAGVVALLLQRRTDRTPVRTGWTVPDQVSRTDFERPEAPWLVAVFTSPFTPRMTAQRTFTSGE